MSSLDNPLAALAAIAACYLPLIILFRYRAAAMRTLALKLGFRYSTGRTPLWFAPRDYQPIPTSFRLRGWPLNKLSRTWNVIEGEINGVSLIILDSVLNLGFKSGIYCTFIAARSDSNPFVNQSPKEKIAHSNGWTAIYRTNGWLIIPWTLSIERIEEHVHNLKA